MFNQDQVAILHKIKHLYSKGLISMIEMRQMLRQAGIKISQAGVKSTFFDALYQHEKEVLAKLQARKISREVQAQSQPQKIKRKM